MISLNWPPIGGAGYQIPEEAEEGWAALSDFLEALGNGAQPQTYQKVSSRTITTSPGLISSAGDCIISVDLTVPGASAISLPIGVSGQWFLIIDGKGDANVNNITVTPNGAQTINGAANYVMTIARQSLMLAYTGSNNWSIVGSFFTSTSGIIQRADIAAGTPDHVIINAASGLLSSEATLAKVRGGTAQDNSSLTFPASGTIPTTSNTLAVFAATTSLQLAGVISDETGSGSLVFATSPTIATPTVTGGSTWDDISTPSTPAAGNIKIYSKAGVPTYVNSSGVEFALANTTTSLTNPMTTAGDLIYGLALGVPQRIAAGASNAVLITGAVPSWGLIANANIDAAANIAITKLSTDVAQKSLTLAQFAATTSAQLAGVISDETGSGGLVFQTSPTLTNTVTITTTPLLSFDAAASTLTYARWRQNGVQKGVVGVDQGNALMGGSTNGDFCFVSPQRMLWNADNGNVAPQMILTTAGALTYGPTSGSANHTARSGGQTQLIVQSGGANNNAYLTLTPAGTGTGRIFVTANDAVISNASDTTMLSITQSGAVNFPLIHNIGSGNITSGRYTPTGAGGANASGVSFNIMHYSRVGNIVTVSGNVGVTCTLAAGTLTTCRITLPVASGLNFTSTQDCVGSGYRAGSSGVNSSPCWISADTANEQAQINFYSNQTAAADCSITFQYEVK